MIREDAISKNYEAFAVDSETEFDAKTMVSEDEDIKITAGDRVACTTRLGLVYTCKRGRAATESSRTVVLLKAQVVLVSALNELREETSPSGKIFGEEYAEEEMVRRVVRPPEEVSPDDMDAGASPQL